MRSRPGETRGFWSWNDKFVAVKICKGNSYDEEDVTQELSINVHQASLKSDYSEHVFFFLFTATDGPLHSGLAHRV